MKFTRLAVFTLATVAWGQPRASLKLTEAIQLALSQHSAEQADLDIAQSRLAAVEAAKGRRIEISPQMAAWAVVNPMSLAVGMGGGLVSPPSISPLQVLDAQLDVLNAEIALERSRFEREAAVTDLFVTYHLQQAASDRICKAWTRAKERKERTEQQVKYARATRIDLIRLDQEILSRGAECTQVDLTLQTVSSKLAELLGIHAAELRLSDMQDGFAAPSELQPVESLYKLAMAYRPMASLQRGSRVDLKEDIAKLWQQLDSAHERRGSIVLKNNGSFEAERTMLQNKLHKLEFLAGQLELRVRARITESRQRVDALNGQLEIARSRVALANEQRKITAARLKAGLANSVELGESDELLEMAESEVRHVQNDSSGSVVALLSVCGLWEQPVQMQALIFRRGVLEASLP